MLQNHSLSDLLCNLPESALVHVLKFLDPEELQCVVKLGHKDLSVAILKAAPGLIELVKPAGPSDRAKDLITQAGKAKDMLDGMKAAGEPFTDHHQALTTWTKMRDEFDTTFRDIDIEVLDAAGELVVVGVYLSDYDAAYYRSGDWVVDGMRLSYHHDTRWCGLQWDARDGVADKWVQDTLRMYFEEAKDMRGTAQMFEDARYIAAAFRDLFGKEITFKTRYLSKFATELFGGKGFEVGHPEYDTTYDTDSAESESGSDYSDSDSDSSPL